MICSGCKNPNAIVTRGFFERGFYTELCNAPECGNIRVPYMPDAFFSKPYMDQNLADEKSPWGQEVRSKRHKAELLKAQGLREDGDRVHGSVFRDAKRNPIKLKPGFKKKLRQSILKNLGAIKK